MMAARRATLILKSGNKEVRYEAEREAVEAQLEHIVGRLLNDSPAGIRVGLADVRPEGAEKLPSAEPSPAAPQPAALQPAAPQPAAPVPEERPAVSEALRLKQLYAISSDGHLRLRKLPERTADALLLVLYGMLKLQDRSSVHAPGMTRAARASGARFDRADRLLAAYQDLIEGFGKRRAKQYRLTAAGRAHCARLVEGLVGPVAAGAVERPVKPQPPTQGAGIGKDAGEDEAGIPKKVTAKWAGELLTVAQAAERLGVTEAEVGKLRRASALLGLPGGDRHRRRHFYPTFQIDAERREIYPEARQGNRLAGSALSSWGVARWWSSVAPELGRRPMELVGTPEADAVVRAARARFEPGGG